MVGDFKTVSADMNEMMALIWKKIDEDFSEKVEFSGKYLFAHTLFLRINEIFKSIMINTEAELYMVASMQLRPLAEAFILLKSSVANPKFNDQYLTKSVKERDIWLSKALRHGDKAGLGKNREHYQAAKEKNAAIVSVDSEALDTTMKLFEKHDEIDMYHHIYMVGNHYLHADARSFKIYVDSEGKLVPHADRSYDSMCMHCCIGAAYVFIKSYREYCHVIGKEALLTNEMFELVKQYNDKYEKTEIGGDE